MHLYSQDRPEASPGIPAILLDGSAVPQVGVFPQETGHIRLTIALRVYDTGSPFTYSQRSLFINIQELETFFISYASDPEATLERYFQWQPQEPNYKQRQIHSSEEKIAAQNYVNDLL